MKYDVETAENEQLIPISFTYPCCGKKSCRYIKVKTRGPRPNPGYYTVNHTHREATCPTQHNILITVFEHHNVNHYRSRVILKAKVRFLPTRPSDPWPKRYKLLITTHAPLMGT
jgi:hypothetical protein